MDLDLQSFDDSLDRLRTLQPPTESSPVNSKVPHKITRCKEKKKKTTVVVMCPFKKFMC